MNFAETNGRDRSELPEEEGNTKISDQWWAEYLSEEDQYKVELGGKITLLSEILKMAESIGDKVYVTVIKSFIYKILQ